MGVALVHLLYTVSLLRKPILEFIYNLSLKMLERYSTHSTRMYLFPSLLYLQESDHAKNGLLLPNLGYI